VIFARETLAEVWDEALPLIRAHGEEIRFVEGLLPDPDRIKLERAEQAGIYVVFVVREPEACALVGYAGFMLAPHLHYRTSTWAVQDVLYVLPRYRLRTAADFMRWTDARLTGMGASVVIRSVSVHRDYSRLLTRMGYSPVGTQYLRRLNA